jgi:hypothetical protein
MLFDLEKEEILSAAKRLADLYIFEQRGIRLVQLEESLQLCSAPEYFDFIRRALETRKPPKLSPLHWKCWPSSRITTCYQNRYRADQRSRQFVYVGLLAKRVLSSPVEGSTCREGR